MLYYVHDPWRDIREIEFAFNFQNILLLYILYPVYMFTNLHIPFVSKDTLPKLNLFQTLDT